MPKVINLTMVGGAYRRGTYCPGWGTVTLDDDSSFYVSEGDAYPNQMLEIAKKKGYSVENMKRRLDVWCKTGVMPNAQTN